MEAARNEAGGVNWTALDRCGRSVNIAEMKRFFRSEAGASVAWLVTSLLLAALLAPWIYRGGMALADACAAKELPGAVEWLGAACERSRHKFGRFFDRSLMLSALALLPFLLWRIRRIRGTAGGDRPYALRKLGVERTSVHVMVGFLVAAVGFALLAWVLVAGEAFVAKQPPPGMGKVLGRTAAPMIVAPLLEEWLFRGLLLGLWLAVVRPFAACVGCSVMFAAVHFLKPPEGTVMGLPHSWDAGFELLGHIVGHFADPVFFVTDFATLFLLGMLLAWTRIRTHSLWMAIGIHAALVGAFKAFNLFFRKVPEHAWTPWGIGESLRSGLLPLAALGLIAIAIGLVMRGMDRVNRA